MKISSSIRELYTDQEDINKRLGKRVKELFEDNKKDTWFYKGRIKEIESFAQKIETGRFKPEALEDFFACTLVVENRTAIGEAIAFVNEFCEIIYQRPRDQKKTHKFPDIFAFDDLRLYVKLKSSEASLRNLLNDVIFEVQIKTFLQHAWSIATHDLIYKGETISWGKARLAYQIKAMLEHAEISIEQVNEIAQSSALAIIDPKTQNLKDVVSWMQFAWPKELLPSDMVRLGNTVIDILSQLQLKLRDMQKAIEQDSAAGYGTKSLNLSPYESMIKAIINHKYNEFLTFLELKNTNNFKILITPEMDIQFKNGTRVKNLLFAKIKR